jgi:uncharacterized membrane protein
MSEALLIFLGALLLLGFLFGTLVLPIIALLRTRRIAQLTARLERLEQGRPLHADRGAQTEQPPLAGSAQQLADLSTRLERLEILVRQTRAIVPQPRERDPEPIAEVTSAPPQEPRTPAPQPSVELPAIGIDAEALESWIGRRGLGWIAVVLLLFASAFFLKYAFENRWIGVLGRISLGIFAGAVLCGAGLSYHRKGWRLFSQMLTAGGVVLLYLASYAAFGYYHLIPQQLASVFLILIIVEAAALAILYDAPAIALMAVIGGLLTPLLLHADRDQYRSLFTYLLILNAGSVALLVLRRWHGIGTVGLVGTELIFGLWHVEHYHPEKLAAALLFQIALFVLYFSHAVAAHIVRHWTADLEDLVRQVLNAGLFFLTAYLLLDQDYHIWMSTLAILLATVYAALAWLALVDPPYDPRCCFVAVAIAMGFVATAIPLQAEAAWIPLGWAVEGFILWWFSLRIRSGMVRYLGAALLVLAIGRLVFVDTPFMHREPFIPLFNSYGLPATLVAACVLGAAASSRRIFDRSDDPDELMMRAFGLAGVLLLWLIISVETYGYFNAAADKVVDAQHWQRTAQSALSGVWAIYAAAILWVGFRLGSLSLRWMALIIFGFTLGKVFLLDLEGLPGLYRVVAFFALSVMMGIAAWAYQRFQLNRSAEREVAQHGTE